MNTLQRIESHLKRHLGSSQISRISQLAPLGVIPTGSLALDIALGVGGIPRGRIVEIFGPASSGKTTLCYHILAETQKMGETATFIDAEHSFNPLYAETCGVDLKSLYISQPDTGEQALEISKTLIASGAVGVIVIDSVAALLPRVEVNGYLETFHLGAQARMMSQALRHLTELVKSTHTVLIFTNQLRHRISYQFAESETTTGGLALRLYAALRLDIRPVVAIKQYNQVIGSRVKVTVKKNKVAPPFRTAMFDILYDKGIFKAKDIFDIAIAQRIIHKIHGFYQFKGRKLAIERDKSQAILAHDAQLLLDIEKQIRAQFNFIKH